LNTQQTSQRKKDHIELAFASQISENDCRFYYEPFLEPHPDEFSIPVSQISDKSLSLPLWVSSMTGGTERAGRINRNLAKACKEFGMGLGLGSCRILLKEKTYLDDFKVRSYLGDDLPLYANLGIAQVEELIHAGKTDVLKDLTDMLEADGLIIHVNPFQEWLQPEGDRIKHSPLSTIKEVISRLPELKLIVKEVGQGFGPQSVNELLQLPLEAIEFGAHGGTNFATLELFRQNEQYKEQLGPLSKLGHTAVDMVNFVNEFVRTNKQKIVCKNIIISGGVKTFLDGYYLTQLCEMNAIYAQASAFLKHSTGEYNELQAYCNLQKKGLQTCYQYLKIRK